MEGALGPPWRPLACGLLAAWSGVAVAGAAGFLTAGPAVGAALGYLLGAVAITASWRQSRFGAANTVTLARVVGCCWVAGLTLEALGGHLSTDGRLLLVGIGVVCLVLDGVDGRVARARGEATEFGARFDVETDAALLICLSVSAAALGVTGWWVLSIGAMRYLYVAAGLLLPVLRRPVPPTLAAKVVAVVQAATLLAGLLLDLLRPGPAPTVLLVAAFGMLVWSFARSVSWQVRRI